MMTLTDMAGDDTGNCPAAGPFEHPATEYCGVYMPNGGEGWFDKSVKRNGDGAFWPVTLETRLVQKSKLPPSQRHGSRRPSRIVEVPLFREYCFARLEEVRHGRPWFETFRAARAKIICNIGADGQPSPGRIPESAIMKLRALINALNRPITDSEALHVREMATLRVGAAVAISSGPFEGLSASVRQEFDVDAAHITLPKLKVWVAGLFGLSECPVDIPIGELSLPLL